MSNKFQHGRSNELDAVIGHALQQAESAVRVDRADLARRREALLGWMNEHVETEPEPLGGGAQSGVDSARRLGEELPVPGPIGARPQIPSDKTGRVLVVDDNKVIRHLIRVNLELEGFEVVSAADGAECLEIVHRVKPDLVLLDVVMPRLDGLRTAARLRADPRTRDLPIVIVSACTHREVEAGCDVGVDAFLGKPFEPVELVTLVQQFTRPEGRRVGHPEHSEADHSEHSEDRAAVFQVRGR